MTTDTDPAVAIWQEALDTLSDECVGLRQHTTRENGDTTMTTNAPTTKTHTTQRSWVLIWTIFAALALLVVGLSIMSSAPARSEPVQTQPATTRGEAIRWVAARLKPCRQEGSRNCHWNARTSGNGYGQSFVDLNGKTYHYGARVR